MSFKSSLIKSVIDWTPSMIMIWVANLMLKGIAELSALELDLETRHVLVQATLCGETEAIEVHAEGFAVTREGESCYFTIRQAQSNRLWLNNILAHLVGRNWKIPEIPQYQAYIDLVAELLMAETTAQTDE